MLGMSLPLTIVCGVCLIELIAIFFLLYKQFRLRFDFDLICKIVATSEKKVEGVETKVKSIQDQYPIQKFQSQLNSVEYKNLNNAIAELAKEIGSMKKDIKKNSKGESKVVLSGNFQNKADSASSNPPIITVVSTQSDNSQLQEDIVNKTQTSENKTKEIGGNKNSKVGNNTEPVKPTKRFRNLYADSPEANGGLFPFVSDEPENTSVFVILEEEGSVKAEFVVFESQKAISKITSAVDTICHDTCEYKGSGTNVRTKKPGVAIKREDGNWYVETKAIIELF